jgi:hypothetical protein
MSAFASTGVSFGSSLVTSVLGLPTFSTARGVFFTPLPHAHTDQLTVTERFTLTGADSLDYDATVTDPETWVDTVEGWDRPEPQRHLLYV